MAQERPNIIVMMGEDTGRHLGFCGDDYAVTPNLDRLAAEGAHYTHGFTHAPVCAPSRGGFVTGRYPWSLGNHHMRCTLAHPPRLFTHELRDAGYKVLWATKLDFNHEPLEGWRDTDENWWQSPPPDQPFFAYVNFGVTHESSMWRTPDQQAKATDRVTEDQRHDPAKARVPAYLPDVPEARKMIADYYDSLTQLDHQAGDILHWVDQHGLRDNTIVIFMSDHGRGLVREKRWCYDAGLHLPLTIRWPGRIEPGSVNDELIAWVDFAPTFCALAGAAIPQRFQGQVFLGPDRAAPREYVFAGRDRMDEVYDRVRVARDKRWHYIRNYYPELPWGQRLRYMEQQSVLQRMRQMRAEGTLTGPAGCFLADRKPPIELYDAQADPDMIHNRADDPDCAPIIQRLSAALDALLAEHGDLADHSERELINRDILTDRLTNEYRLRMGILPEPHRFGPDIPLLEKEEVEAWIERTKA